MSTLLDQIDIACARGRDLALGPLAAGSRGKVPAELSSPEQLDRRRRFLYESLGDTALAHKVYERIISGNELQSVNYLARGARAAQAVARIAIDNTPGGPRGWGTGFLIAPGVLLTNNHVLPDAGTAQRSLAQFRYELDIEGRPLRPTPFSLRPERLFMTSVERDFSVVAVAEASLDGAAQLNDFGHLPLVSAVGKVAEGEWLTIIQHPGGELKQLCVRENQLIKIDDDVLWYSTDTMGGSSGSPVHNNDWYVVALHHAGVPVTVDGRIQTVDGRDFDDQRDTEKSIKWVANEGIRVSRIVAELRARAPDEPLLKPVFEATPAEARMRIPQALITKPKPVLQRMAAVGATKPVSLEPLEAAMDDFSAAEERRITVTLGISANGAVRVLGEARESAAFEAARRAAVRELPFDVPFNPDYSNRHGYDPDFLGQGALHVALPELNAANRRAAAKLIGATDANDFVLRYHNYSVVMHEKRRLAFYSAANVDFSGRYSLARPSDRWQMDSRIPTEAQLTNFYYNKNRFDRGHLTRREDLEFGPSRLAALESAADTCHWTNCTPQQSIFNQKAPYWQGIERYLLEDSIKRDSFKAQVITGPILDEDDPVWDAYPKIRYPARYWKVVAALDSAGALFATAYILDQTELIDKFGIDESRDIPFGPYGTPTYQVPIQEVERLTGLAFRYGAATANGRRASLSDCDPLARSTPRSSHRPSRMQESTGTDVPRDYLLLDSLERIYRGPDRD